MYQSELISFTPGHTCPPNPRIATASAEPAERRHPLPRPLRGHAGAGVHAPGSRCRYGGHPTSWQYAVWRLLSSSSLLSSLLFELEGPLRVFHPSVVCCLNCRPWCALGGSPGEGKRYTCFAAQNERSSQVPSRVGQPELRPILHGVPPAHTPTPHMQPLPTTEPPSLASHPRTGCTGERGTHVSPRHPCQHVTPAAGCTQYPRTATDRVPIVSHTQSAPEQTDVVIIGSGVGGLSCGAILAR